MGTAPTRPKVTISCLRKRKRTGSKFTVLTCYDYTTATMLEEAGIDAVLVGDTAGEVILGHATTIPTKLDFLLTLTEAVRRGAPSVFLIGDMPFLTYQVSIEEAIRNAGRFVSEAGCDAVKLEVDSRHLDVVAALSRAGIPVMAHLGMRPQCVKQEGGYRAKGRDSESAMQLLDDARRFEEAGAGSLLLEAVTAEVAERIVERTELPVVGIASGPACDGQVVVLHDLLGLGGGHPPSCVKQYADLRSVMIEHFGAYAREVMAGRFPGPEHCLHMHDGELSRLDQQLGPLRPLPLRTLAG